MSNPVDKELRGLANLAETILRAGTMPTPERRRPKGGHMTEFISRPKYDGFTREGTSTYVRALRVGTRRFVAEFCRPGFYIRLGAITFHAGFEWADD